MTFVEEPPQARTCEPVAPLIAQSPAVDCVLSDQLRPAGSGSLTVTPWAVPAPLLLTVIVNPTALPWFTVAASAVFTMWIEAPLQVIDAVELSEPSLVVVTWAVLL